MGLLDSIKGMFGGGKSNLPDVNELKDQAINMADTNNDGKVDMSDLEGAKTVLDQNNDGNVDMNDLSAAKDNFLNKK